MESSIGKKTSGTVAQENIVLLLPNKGGNGNWVTEWEEDARKRSLKQDEYTKLALSILFTGKEYVAPFANRQEIIEEYTTPAVVAGPGIEARDAIPPSAAVVEKLELDAHCRRSKIMDGVKAAGTDAFEFLMESMAHASQVIIQADARYLAANTRVPKNHVALYQLMAEKLLRGGAGGVQLSSAEKDRIDDQWHVFKQGDLPTDDYHRLFVKWLEKRKSVGLPDLSPEAVITKFYGKLDDRRYAELKREKENTEQALLLADLPVAEMTLAQALQHVQSWVPPLGQQTHGAKAARGVSVFAAREGAGGADAAETRIIESVLLALKTNNSNTKKAAGKPAASEPCGESLMVGGRRWTRPCIVEGCNGCHPYYLHRQITGTPCCPATQKKIDEFNEKKAERKSAAAAKKKNTVLAAAAEDSDDDADHYFIHCVAETGAHGEQESDDDEYNPLKYSVMTTRVSVSTTAASWVELFRDWFVAVLVFFAIGVLSHVVDVDQLGQVYAFPVAEESPFSSGYVLLDNQAGMSMVNTIDLLIDVRELKKPRQVSGISAGKSLTATHDGELPGLPGFRFPYVEGASANILAECDVVAAGWEITRRNGMYQVVTDKGTRLEFTLLPNWKAHYACRVDSIVQSNSSDAYNVKPVETSAALATTVAENRSKYSTSQVHNAEKARQLQENLGLPCSQYMKQGLSGITNTGITPQDISRADAIGGPPLAKIRGGTHHYATPAAHIEAELPRPTTVPLTAEIDIMFVYGLAFLICVLLPLNHVMAVYIKHRTVAEISAALLSFIAAAAARKFALTFFRCDGEKAVAAYAQELNNKGIRVESQPGVKCPHVERTNQTLGEYVRGQLNGGFAARMGKALVVMCVLFKASRLNTLPTKASTDNFGSFVTWEGRTVDAKRDLSWHFGQYAEAKKDSLSKSKYASRTSGCILGIPTMNSTGSVLMYQLSTRTMVTRTKFQVRPMPDWVINELEEIADEDNLPSGDEYIGDNSWDFKFEDDVDAPAAPVVPPHHQDAVGAGVIGAPQVAANNVPANENVGGERIRGDMAGRGIEGIEAPHTEGILAPPQIPAAVDSAVPAAAPAAAPPQQPLQLPAPARRGRFGGGDSLTSAPGRVLLNTKELEDRAAIRNELLKRRNWHDKEFCFKISVKAALRDRGDSAKAAIIDELQNIVDKGVFHGVHVHNLTSEQRKSILRSVTFLKDKYTAQNIFEKFKARMCVDGSRQDHSMYEDVSSPTATCASVLSCAAIAAAEHRHVMTVDVKGAFLHADMKATGVTVHVQLDKIMTKFLLEIDPTYAEFVRDDGTCVVQLDKALYGTIEAAKLWYDNISAQLLADGYVQNPYDQCVFNKVNANGLQITVVLYVDDMIVSCEDPLELDKFSAMLRARYGADQITEHRGKILDFLGMTFDFMVPGKAKVTMKHLVNEIIAGCGVIQERKTPATEDLFETRDTVDKLGPEQRDYFRSYTAKLLYVGKRVKPEMLTAISFLTTRANSPDTDDLAKLQRALGYLLYTRDRGIVLSIGDTMTVGGFIDAAYGVHTGSGKSHSGCAMVLGNAGPVHVKSTKQKLVTKSSTEAELVALSDYASQAIWLRNFIIAQGYDVGPVILHQDNMSCMALVKRGGPASERSRHIDIRYFWVKEKVDGKDAIVKHLPTDKMFVNVMTKPVQGQQFIRERNALTNWF